MKHDSIRFFLAKKRWIPSCFYSAAQAHTPFWPWSETPFGNPPTDRLRGRTPPARRSSRLKTAYFYHYKSAQSRFSKPYVTTRRPTTYLPSIAYLDTSLPTPLFGRHLLQWQTMNEALKSKNCCYYYNCLMLNSLCDCISVRRTTNPTKMQTGGVLPNGAVLLFRHVINK